MSLTQDRLVELSNILGVDVGEIPVGLAHTEGDKLEGAKESIGRGIKSGHLPEGTEIIALIDQDLYEFDAETGDASSCEQIAVVKSSKGLVGLLTTKFLLWLTENQMKSFKSLISDKSV